MTRREIEQGIMERVWQIRLWGGTEEEKQEVFRMSVQLWHVEDAAIISVCRRAICLFGIGLRALQATDWNEDEAVLLIMRVRYGWRSATSESTALS